MTRACRRASAFLATAVTLIGCTSALHDPPSMAELAAPSSPATEQPVDLNRLIEEAGQAFSLRPDVAGVERARALYLEAGVADQQGTDALLGAARATAWLVENEENSARRQALAIEGVQICQRCALRDPSRSECSYRLALAVGQQAREKPSTAVDGIEVMVGLLETLIDEKPTLDFAGPDRVLALVLLRAPGWPSGPGDPLTGTLHARRAIDLFPDFPPNQVVLGEALIEEGRTEEARQTLESAISLADKRASLGDPDAQDWRRDAEGLLERLQ